jgi:hypothetical protein
VLLVSIDEAAVPVDACGGLREGMVVVVGGKGLRWQCLSQLTRIGKPRAAVPPEWSKRYILRVDINGLMA